MRITVSSGNRATITIQDAGKRAVLDVDWHRTPTTADVKEPNRLLRVGDKALNVTIEDDAKRGEFARAFLADQQETERTQ